MWSSDALVPFQASREEGLLRQLVGDSFTGEGSSEGVWGHRPSAASRAACPRKRTNFQEARRRARRRPSVCLICASVETMWGSGGGAVRVVRGLAGPCVSQMREVRSHPLSGAPSFRPRQSSSKALQLQRRLSPELQRLLLRRVLGEGEAVSPLLHAVFAASSSASPEPTRSSTGNAMRATAALIARRSPLDFFLRLQLGGASCRPLFPPSQP